MQEKSFAFERKAAYLSDAMASGGIGPYWTAAAARIRLRLEGDRGSQKRLASKAGVSEPTLSRFLDGKSEPSLDEAVRIADALGWPPHELLGAVNAWRPAPPEGPERGLPPEVLEAVRGLSKIVERHVGTPGGKPPKPKSGQHKRVSRQ
jgi:transcriptional regulator with XRE-family HTH domain